MSQPKLQAIIERINHTYSSWNKHTTITHMRRDWDALFSGPLAPGQLQDISINSLQCRWFFPEKYSIDGVVLYIHGGGFRLGSIDSHQQLMANIAHYSHCPVLGINYRLMPEHIYPAALNDTEMAYQWLLDKGYRADQIIIAGDSAGGQLAAGLLQKLQQHKAAQPAGAVLLSAWLDMSLSGASYDTRAKDDPIHQRKMLAVIAKEYLADNNPKASQISPLFGDLSDLPPTLLQVGDREVGLDDSVAYAQALIDAGSQAELQVYDNMIHVFQMFADELEEATLALKRIGDFIQQHLPNKP